MKKHYKPFDSAFKTLLFNHPRLSVPLINEAFQKQYITLDEQLSLTQTIMDVFTALTRKQESFRKEVTEYMGGTVYKMQYQIDREKEFKKGLRKGKIEGKQEGRQEGEGLMARLMSALLENGMVNEAKRATADEIYRAELYKQYNII